jgi:hypothetical protein
MERNPGQAQARNRRAHDCAVAIYLIDGDQCAGINSPSTVTAVHGHATRWRPGWSGRWCCYGRSYNISRCSNVVHRTSQVRTGPYQRAGWTIGVNKVASAVGDVEVPARRIDCDVTRTDNRVKRSDHALGSWIDNDDF